VRKGISLKLINNTEDLEENLFFEEYKSYKIFGIGSSHYIIYTYYNNTFQYFYNKFASEKNDIDNCDYRMYLVCA